MAGLYVHIPFCKSRCIYCGFYSTTLLDLRQKYVDAVCREIRLRGERLEVRGEVFRGEWREVRGERNDLRAEEEINTIYLGGGTPSQLTMEQLQQIFDTLARARITNRYSLTSYLSPLTSQEVTIEVNPDDVTEAFAKGLATLPVNRVSMGVQTFNNERLRFLHRRHTAAQVGEAIGRLRAAGIGNISIDLMYGFPGETLEDWKADIDQALALNVEHISSYCLMIEEGTPLYQMLEKGRIAETDEELERQMYETLIDRLKAAGYEHYELSNFAKKGFHSRHNSSYWDGTPYIGIGAAAHSYDIESRSWNTADIRQYIEGMENGRRIYEEERIDDDTRYNDAITTALRTARGLDLKALSQRHHDYCLENAQRFLADGLLELTTDHRLKLTHRGLFVSDMVMSYLIYMP